MNQVLDRLKKRPLESLDSRPLDELRPSLAKSFSSALRKNIAVHKLQSDIEQYSYDYDTSGKETIDTTVNKIRYALGYIGVLSDSLFEIRFNHQANKHAYAERSRIHTLRSETDQTIPLDIPKDPNQPIFSPDETVDELTANDILQLKTMVKHDSVTLTKKAS